MVNANTLYQIRDVIRKHLAQEEVKEAFLFATNAYNPKDFNYFIGVKANKDIPNYKFEVIKEELISSDIAYNVELTDISKKNNKLVELAQVKTKFI